MSTKWNDIPYDESASPADKALAFDNQYAENHEAAQVKNDATPLFPKTPEEKK